MAPSKARASLAPLDASECRHIVEVTITTDDHPEETTWEIVSVTTGRFLTGYRSVEDLRPERSLKAYTEYSWKICASGLEGTFLFRLHDTGLDGIRPPGKYVLAINGSIVKFGGPFVGDSLTEEFSTVSSA